VTSSWSFHHRSHHWQQSHRQIHPWHSYQLLICSPSHLRARGVVILTHSHRFPRTESNCIISKKKKVEKKTTNMSCLEPRSCCHCCNGAVVVAAALLLLLPLLLLLLMVVMVVVVCNRRCYSCTRSLVV
jgi:hypothetical protein